MQLVYYKNVMEKKMDKSIVFMDFENLQKLDIELINSETKIIVLIGLDQEKNAIEFVKNMLQNVSSIELIKVNGKGKNALDFFITFYLGKYFESIKDLNIIICSKDTGYDPLIKHLEKYSKSIKRIGLTENIKETENEVKLTKPKQKNQISVNNTDEVNKIIGYLQNQTKSQKSKLPKKVTTLENYLLTHFANKIKKDKIKIAIKYMEDKKYISKVNNKINYISI
jgi:hypothetical protein